MLTTPDAPGVGDSPTARGRRRALALALLRVVAGTAILIALFRLIPSRGIFLALERARPGWLLVAFLSALAVQWPVSARLRMLADVQGLRLSTFEVLRINLETRFYGLVLPGGAVTSVAVRSLRLGSSRTGYVGAFTAVALDRILSTLTLCGVGILFWLLARPPHSTTWLVVMAGAFAGLCAAMVVASRLFSATAAATDHRLPFVGTRLARISEAVEQARGMRTSALGRALGLSALAHLLGIAAHVCIAASLGLNLGAATIGWIRTVLALAAMVPISVAGVGLREGASLLTLPALGVGEESAVAYGLLVSVVTILGVGLVGGVLEASRLLVGRIHPG